MRVAAIDIGTNSFHMIVAEVRPDGAFEIVDREKEMVRLGAGGLDGGALSTQTIETGCATLARFARLARSRGVDETMAIATSAVREASNGGEFLQEAARRTGIRARLITGNEEARLIHRAAVYGVKSGTGPTVVFDIGGGTTEITVGNAATVRSARSFRLGVLRLTERFVRRDPIGRKDEHRLVSHIEDELGPHLSRLAASGFDRVIATSGTALNLGEIALQGAALFGDRVHHARLPVRQLHRVRKQIVAADMRQRLRLPGLDSRRADLIVAGAVLADTIVSLLGAREITLCDFALREGLLLDFISRNTSHIAQVDRYPDIRRRSVVELGERCGWYAEHAQQVARLSLSLFDQTRALHELDDRVREWLEFAALLHDIGSHISFTAHHRHSYYLIRNGGLRGFEPVEIQVMALIARYHRRRRPSKSDAPLAALPRDLRRSVCVAAALLRLAEALDRTHAQIVKGVKFRETRRGTSLVVRAGGEAELEIWAARRQVKPLSRLLGRPIAVE